MWFQKPPLGTQLDWNNYLNKGVVMHLAMNEGHGDKVQDLSMNGNHGTLNNMAFPPTVASGWNPGQTGIGLKFDGGNDYVSCGNNPVLNGKSALTISALIRSGTTAPAIQNVITKGDNNIGTGEYYLCYYNGNRLMFFITNGAVHAQCLITKTLLTNKWYNFVGTYDGVSAKMYLDGVEIDSDAAVLGDLNNTSNNVYIGAEGAFDNFNGNIDQPRIQSRVWSAKEVKEYAINPWQVYLDEDD